MSAKREKLVETAQKLFARAGYHATGIDKIIAEAGVARMTLYKHFKSKDELILAALRRRDEEFREWLIRTVERRAADPRGRLLAIFDAVAEWIVGQAFPDRPFTGCSFINAAAEFSDPNHPVHRAAAEHKALLLDYVRKLAAAAGAKAPEMLARQLLLLKEGAIVTAQVSGDSDAAHNAKAVAVLLLEREFEGVL